MERGIPPGILSGDVGDPMGVAEERRESRCVKFCVVVRIVCFSLPNICVWKILFRRDDFWTCGGGVCLVVIRSSGQHSCE